MTVASEVAGMVEVERVEAKVGGVRNPRGSAQRFDVVIIHAIVQPIRL